MKQFNNIFVGTAINQQGPLLNMQTVLQVAELDVLNYDVITFT